MRHFIVVAMLAAGLSLPGCIYVPPIWDNADEIHKVDQIEEGTTTREEVLNLLGEPDSERENVFYYSGSTSDGYIIYGTPYIGPAYGGLIDEDAWWIWITFDENGVVREVSTEVSSEVSSKKEAEWMRKRQEQITKRREELTLKADKGDTQSQYELAISAPTDEEMLRWQRLLSEKAQRGDPHAQYWLSKYYYSRDKIEDFVRWRCYAANQGYPEAQFSIGRSYQYGDETTERDPILARMWLALAEASTVRSVRSAYSEALVKSMSPTQIAEAERLVAEWKPDPSACEVEAASSS